MEEISSRIFFEYLRIVPLEERKKGSSCRETIYFLSKNATLGSLDPVLLV